MKLIPADRKRCQAEKRAATVFSCGYHPDDLKLKRCVAAPTAIATETKPGKDGQRGSMSLCDECRAALEKQGPAVTFKPIRRRT